LGVGVYCGLGSRFGGWGVLESRREHGGVPRAVFRDLRFAFLGFTLDAVYVYEGQSFASSRPSLIYEVQWSEFPIVPSYPHYPQVWGVRFGVWAFAFRARTN